MQKGFLFYIHTLGCPKNEVDSDVLLSLLLTKGFIRTDKPEKADVILINSCGFIKASKEETLDTVFSFHRSRKDSQKIILLGCLAQRYSHEIENLLPEVDGFIGSDEYQKIDRIVVDIVSGRRSKRYHGQKKPVSMLYRYSQRDYRFLSGSSTYIKIADGCSNRCSFCAIPHIKGRYRSRRVDDILKEAENLVKAGYYEIGLVSQDLTAYGFDLGYRDGLMTLLREIDTLSGSFWIRLYYLYPRRIRKELLELICRSNRIVHYIDMPLQHISDRILRLMRRGHGSVFIRKLISDIRSAIPDVVLRSAFITGFPGESVSDFNELMRFLSEYKLNNVGFFEYSDEEGTQAYNLPKKVDIRTIKKRYQKLYETQELISYNLNQQHIGRVYDVLIDSEEKEFYLGRYYGQAPEIDGMVFIRKSQKRCRGFVKVRIEDADSYDLYGSIVPC